MTKILLFNYRRLPYWKQYGEPIIEILNKKHRRLIDLNMELLQFIAESLGISWGKISLQSSYKYSGNKSELMASLAHAAGGNIYLSGGNKSDHYNDTKIYCSYDVTLKYQDFVHPHYDQGQRNFEPGLSVIDALIRFGKDTMPMVRKVNPEN